MGAFSGVLRTDGVGTGGETGRFASLLPRSVGALVLALATVVSLALHSTRPAAPAYVYDGEVPTAPLVEVTPLAEIPQGCSSKFPTLGRVEL